MTTSKVQPYVSKYAGSETVTFRQLEQEYKEVKQAQADTQKEVVDKTAKN